MTPSEARDALLQRAGELFDGHDVISVLCVLEAAYQDAAIQAPAPVRELAAKRLQLLAAELEAIDAQRH